MIEVRGVLYTKRRKRPSINHPAASTMFRTSLAKYIVSTVLHERNTIITILLLIPNVSFEGTERIEQ